MKSSNYNELVTEAIDETFSKLGLEVQQVFYSFLEDNYILSKQDIPDRIGDFVEALDAFFGISASLVEIDFVMGLRQKVPSFVCVVEGSDLHFEAYLASLKKYIENID